EGRLDRRLMRHVRMQDLGEAVVQLAKTRGQIRLVIGADGTGRNKAQRISEAVNDAPPSAAQARVYSNDSNRVSHGSTYPWRGTLPAGGVDSLTAGVQPRAKAVSRSMIWSDTGLSANSSSKFMASP